MKRNNKNNGINLGLIKSLVLVGFCFPGWEWNDENYAIFINNNNMSMAYIRETSFIYFSALGKNLSMNCHMFFL